MTDGHSVLVVLFLALNNAPAQKPHALALSLVGSLFVGAIPSACFVLVEQRDQMGGVAVATTPRLEEIVDVVVRANACLECLRTLLSSEQVWVGLKPPRFGRQGLER